MIKDDIARIFRKYYDTDMTIQHTGIESINEALDNRDKYYQQGSDSHLVVDHHKS